MYLPSAVAEMLTISYIPYYNDFFYTEQDHWNFIGKDTAGSTVIVSVANNDGREQFRSYVVNNEGAQRVLIPACKEKEAAQHIKTVVPSIGNNLLELTLIFLAKINKVKAKKFSKEYFQQEQMQNANNYKWGVLYMKDGQTEDQMYSNSKMTLTDLGTNIIKIKQALRLKSFLSFWERK
jgi:hypothetical protein